MLPTPTKEALSGENRGENSVLRRGNSDVKEEFAPIFCYVCSSEENVGVGCDDEPVEQELWHDVSEGAWRDAESDEWFERESWSAETWYDCQCDVGCGEAWHDAEEEHWYDAKRFFPRSVRAEIGRVPVPQRTPKPEIYVPITSFPSVMMLLSYVMISMYNVGMRLRMQGLRATQVWMTWGNWIADRYKLLKLYWWPPPCKLKNENTSKNHRKKMLLTALAKSMDKWNALFNLCSEEKSSSGSQNKVPKLLQTLLNP